jgi:hypothetical protein
MVSLYSTRAKYLPYALVYELLFCEMLSSSIVFVPFFCYVFVFVFCVVCLANVAGRLSASLSPDCVRLRTASTIIPFDDAKLVKIFQLTKFFNNFLY